MNIADDAGSQRPDGSTTPPDQPTDRPDGTADGPGHSYAYPALAASRGDDRTSTAPALTLRQVLARPETASGPTGTTVRRGAGGEDDTDEISATPTPSATGDDATDETAIQPARNEDDTDEITIPPATAEADDGHDEAEAEHTEAEADGGRAVTTAEAAAGSTAAWTAAPGDPDTDPGDGADEPAAPDEDEDEPAAPDEDDAPVGPWQRLGSAVLLAVAAVVGSLPVLWVMGAVWWRHPTLLVENMYSGFTQCALDYGTLTPLEMVCPRAGMPLGMYQLDGGLSYPLGGALQLVGVDQLASWKWSVAVLIVAGTGALYWVLRRLMGSPALAMCFVAVYALGGTLTGRTWNWYWNVTAAALLPIVFAAAYVLYRRAPERRLPRMVVPGVWLVLGVLAVSLEWQYAGLFATATAAGAVLLITLQRGWRWWQRPALLVGIAAGMGAVVATLRWRLTVAGIEEQFEETVVTAGRHSIAVATFLVPDQPMTVIGHLLGLIGYDQQLVRSMVQGNQLWVAPYIGVLVAAFLLLVWLFRRLRLRPSPGRPRGFLLFLLLVAVACVVLGLGPVIRLAPLTQPSSVIGSPVAALYPSTPLQWIRYPWTWGYLLHVTLVLLYAALTVALLRRGAHRWSLLIVPLLVLLAVDFVSPQVLRARTSPEPSIALAPEWTRVDSEDPAAADFEQHDVAELHDALAGFERPVVMYPWGNAWITPSLGPDAGVPVRNVGIDRNLRQIVDASPYGYGELKRPDPETLRGMLDSGWAAALVLLDHMPTGDSILRFDHQHLQPRDTRRLVWNRNREQEFFEAGYCLEDHSWFTIVTTCDRDAPAGARALASPRP